MKAVILSIIATVAIAAPSAASFFSNKGTETAPNMPYRPQYL